MQLRAMIVLLAAATAAVAQPFKETWTVTGLGGAGGMYTPTISPFDSKLMFLSCDMSGAYRLADGGKSWQLIHYMQLRSSLGCRPAFLSATVVYWAEGNSLRVSADGGAAWQAVENPPWKDSVTHIAVAAGAVPEVLVGTGAGVWSAPVEKNGKPTGKWSELAKGKCGGMAAAGDAVYVASTAGDGKILRRLLILKGSRDSADVPLPVKGKPVIALAAGQAKAVEPARPAICAIVEGEGTFWTTDLGAKWEKVQKWQGQKDVLMPPGQDQVAYAAQEGGHEVWRTADGGKTWTSIFHMTGGEKNVDVAWTQTQIHWDYSISHLGIGIDPAKTDVVMMCSEGDFYRSNDGGKSWAQCQNEVAGDKGKGPERYRSIGLEVTSLWGYYFDPNDANRQYICYTDIGFGRSTDGAATWMWSAKGCPWGNTFYEIAFDPHTKGRIYAACSNRHDIPHWTHLDANKRNHAGGVCVSDDFGANWKVLGKGLPALPCTSIAVDPKSPAGKLTLYTTLYEGGLYKSTDGGATWEKKSDGLGNAGNLHAIRVRVHPASGNLYCMITGFRSGREFKVPGGLWRSTDGGATWKDLTVSAKFPRPTDFAVHPKDENVIYINASTIPGSEVGGIYKTTDGGATWKRLLSDADFGRWCPPSYYEGSTVTLHPDDPGIVYAGTDGHGLWYSTDAGAKWQVYKSFPFSSPQNVAFDPSDHKKMIVTTFGGGAWRGPYQPQP